MIHNFKSFNESTKDVPINQERSVDIIQDILDSQR